jgi:hypothetical protein
MTRLHKFMHRHLFFFLKNMAHRRPLEDLDEDAAPQGDKKRQARGPTTDDDDDDVTAPQPTSIAHPTPHFLDLPLDVIVAISEFCPLKALMALRATCQQLKKRISRALGTPNIGGRIRFGNRAPLYENTLRVVPSAQLLVDAFGLTTAYTVGFTREATRWPELWQVLTQALMSIHSLSLLFDTDIASVKCVRRFDCSNLTLLTTLRELDIMGPTHVKNLGSLSNLTSLRIEKMESVDRSFTRLVNLKTLCVPNGDDVPLGLLPALPSLATLDIATDFDERWWRHDLTKLTSLTELTLDMWKPIHVDGLLKLASTGSLRKLTFLGNGMYPVQDCDLLRCTSLDYLHIEHCLYEPGCRVSNSLAWCGGPRRIKLSKCLVPLVGANELIQLGLWHRGFIDAGLASYHATHFRLYDASYLTNGHKGLVCVDVDLVRERADSWFTESDYI